MRRTAIYIAFLMAGMRPFARGAPPAPTTPGGGSPVPPLLTFSIEAMDRMHERLSGGVTGISDRLDDFFGEGRSDEESAGSLLRVRTGLIFKEPSRIDTRYKFKGRLALPKLENRLQLIVDSFSGEDPEVVESEIPREDESDTFAGLRLRLTEHDRLRVSLDGGAKYDNGPEGFFRVRGRKSFDCDPWLIRITEDVFWFNEDGFALRTRLDVERRLNTVLFVRSTSRGSWSEVSDGVDWRQSLSLYRYQRTPVHRAFGTTVYVQGHTHPSTETDQFGLQLKFRRNLYKDWMFLELVPEANFPEERDYAFTPIGTVRLEWYFGDPTPGRRR